MFGVKVSPGSKCPGSKFSGSKCRRGQSVAGVKVSPGSKCRRGQNVPGVKVSPGSKCLWGQNGCEPFSALNFKTRYTKLDCPLR